MSAALTNPLFWQAIATAAAPFVLATVIAGAWLKWDTRPRRVNPQTLDNLLNKLAGHSPTRHTIDELDAARRTIHQYLRNGKHVDDLVGFTTSRHPSGHIWVELITKSSVVAEAETILHRNAA